MSSSPRSIACGARRAGRRIRTLSALATATLAAVGAVGCGADEPGRSESELAAGSATAGAVGSASAPVDTDPCGLVPRAEWVSATGYRDVVPDRSARDTCDFLSDSLWGVVGTVSLQDREFLTYMTRRYEDAAPVEGLGDEAVAFPLGLVARRGDRVIFLTVNPGVEENAAVARRLMRVALGRL